MTSYPLQQTNAKSDSPTVEVPPRSNYYTFSMGLLVVLLAAALAYASYAEYTRRKALEELGVVTNKLKEIEQASLLPSSTANSYATLRQAYPAARAAADATSSLAGAFGIEARNIQQFKDCFSHTDRVERGTVNVQPENAQTNRELHDAVISLFSGPYDDQNIADGKASAWIFSFQGPTGYRVVVVNALESRVVFNRGMPLDPGLPTGRTGAEADVPWIDSDQMTRGATADIPNYEARRREAILAIHALALKEGQAPFYNTSLMGRDDICLLPSGHGSIRDWEWAGILIDAMSSRVISRGTLYEGQGKEGVQPQDPPPGSPVPKPPAGNTPK